MHKTKGRLTALALLSWATFSGAEVVGLPSAETHLVLGNKAKSEGNLESAESHFRSALELRRATHPDQVPMAQALTLLGRVLVGLGKVEGGREHCQQAARIFERLSPENLDAAWSWSCLGIAGHRQGDILLARQFHQRAFTLRNRLAPDSLDLADSFNSLGTIALARRDLDRADELFRQALGIRNRLAPDSLELATTMGNLGIVAAYREDFAAAEVFLRRDLAIKQKMNPHSSRTADSLTNLGNVMKNHGDPAAAEDFFSQALHLHQRLQPESLRVAIGHYSLGNIALDRGDLETAETHLSRAVSLREKLGSTSVGAALAFQALGDLHLRRGHIGQSVPLLRRAVDTLEAQIRALGGSHRLPGSFRERYEPVYRQAVFAMAENGEGAAAFHYLEKSRARRLLAMLAARDQSPSMQSPSMQLPETAEKELQSPSPADLEEARSMLDAGTLALAYSIDEEESLLFAITPKNGLERVVKIEIGGRRLGAEVETLRKAVLRARQRHSVAFSAFETMSRRLFQRLIAPVTDLVDDAERVLIIPDGGLHLLPFGLLLDNGDPEHYLVERKPLHSVLSATLFAELRGRRPVSRVPSTKTVAIFADPSYADGQRRDGARGTDEAPVEWPLLPHTRREALGISALFPASQVRLHLGNVANKVNVMAMDRATGIAHFAIHGLLDDRSPFDSALVLSPGAEEGDEGLLRAREIFDNLRLDADLVVLSACATALGKQRGGEGLIGLTRAFQYAGARSVVATLWGVDDRVSAELMIRFHHHLRDGESFAEALRGAKVDLLSGEVEILSATGESVAVDTAVPVYWAGFELIGDWR